MTVAVLGADGYLGWNLVLRLAASGCERLVLADSGIKRRLVAESGARSALPLASVAERLAALRDVFPSCRTTWIAGDVADTMPEVFSHHPRVVFHLAQIPSAPFSMRGFEEARLVLLNNEVGHLALLHAARELDSSVHLVKMGSMGGYARIGLPIPEGKRAVTIDGRTSDRPVLFPQEAGDVYHACKINETTLGGMACRSWGLRLTEIMLSTVFGAGTAASRLDRRLSSRLDVDPAFGTVIHRLAVQRLRGEPLTVYGRGDGRTGLTVLDRALDALTGAVGDTPEEGEHRIVNVRSCHVVRVGELAKIIDDVGRERGLPPAVLEKEHDPRSERDTPHSDCEIESLRGPGLADIRAAIGTLLDELANADVLPAAAEPDVCWRRGHLPKETAWRRAGSR